MKELPQALAALAEYKQFICWRAVPAEGGKTDKLPVNPRTGQVCNAHDPTAWVTAEEALATGMPIAFVLTDQDPNFCLDIDNCLNPDGTWSPTAVALCAIFAGCAVEVSQSGKGLHIFGVQTMRLPHSSDNKTIGSQFYTTRRFIALTGTGITGNAGLAPDPKVYSDFIDNYFPPRAVTVGGDWTSGPDPLWDGPEDDTELIKRMLKAKSARGILGKTVTVKQLWEADEDALGKIFPDDQGTQARAFDWSLADAALCSHLAFWTGKNCERMDALFQKSALVRGKWREREEYKINTIQFAVSNCQRVYKQRGKPDSAVVPQDGEVTRPGFQFFTLQDQAKLFEGCCYVRDIHRIFVADGGLLKPDQFRATFGGYVFALDAMGDKTTRNAWEIFTESQAVRFPRVHTTCFRPELAPGAIIDREGIQAVNTYVPAPTPRVEGDPAPFLDFLARLLPVPRDREILLAYMAACVQHIGVKFQWAPLLQGVEGNGKSFIGRCLTKAIGEKYTHKVNPKDIGNVFNSWLTGKLMILIEEVHTKDSVGTIETLKWMVTDERVPLQAKGQGQITGDNRANFFMSSNHRDAIKKTMHDRRFCVFYTAQQEFKDLAASGMSGAYFPNLYDWAKNKDGYGIVTNYLMEYSIPAELNPALTCHRAPVTSSTDDVIISSRGLIEQDVIEATESDRPGFTGGWISSMAFDRLLESKRVVIPMNRRREILKELGYVPHPALRNGRVNNAILQEGGKPRLYVKEGHAAWVIPEACEVTRAYQAAQGYVPER